MLSVLNMDSSWFLQAINLYKTFFMERQIEPIGGSGNVVSEEEDESAVDSKSIK
jgi:hypothetical protein